MALQRHPKIKVVVRSDERSRAFFAVGLGKVTGKPAVVLCTSGTAAAELHAAVVEASYSSTPLIVITADRPPELQDVGANQSIDQQRLYGTAVRWFFDPGVPVEIPGAPRIWRRLARGAASPTARALNSWLAAASPPTFLLDPDHMWPDQDHLARHVVACDPQALLEALPPANRAAWRDEWVSAGKKAGAAISATLISTPVHEGHVVRALASRLPETAQVFIGSRMPIRPPYTFSPLSKPPPPSFSTHPPRAIH